jgi:hypothetical protein
LTINQQEALAERVGQDGRVDGDGRGVAVLAARERGERGVLERLVAGLREMGGECAHAFAASFATQS